MHDCHRIARLTPPLPQPYFGMKIWSEHYGNLNIRRCRFLCRVYFRAAGCATKANSISIVPLSRVGGMAPFQHIRFSGRLSPIVFLASFSIYRQDVYRNVSKTPPKGEQPSRSVYWGWVRASPHAPVLRMDLASNLGTYAHANRGR